MKFIKSLLKIEILFLITLFSLLIYKIDFPRKFYNLLRLDYDQRITKTYGYCSNYSSGFIKNIYTKYDFKEIPTIIKYTGSRNPYWVIQDIKKKSNTDYIFIKHNSVNLIYLEKVKNNSFVYNFSYKNNYKKLKKLSFSITDINDLERFDVFSNKDKKFSLNLDKAVKKGDVFEINTSKEINDDFYKNKFSEINYIFKPIYKSNKQTNLVMEMKIHFENIYDLSKFKIIEQFEDCYYVKKTYE